MGKIIIGIVWKIIIGNGRKLTHDVEAMIQKRHLHHFQASRWGHVTEMNKITFPLERCRQNEFSPSHAAWEKIIIGIVWKIIIGNGRKLTHEQKHLPDQTTQLCFQFFNYWNWLENNYWKWTEINA